MKLEGHHLEKAVFELNVNSGLYYIRKPTAGNAIKLQMSYVGHLKYGFEFLTHIVSRLQNAPKLKGKGERNNLLYIFPVLYAVNNKKRYF